jgi:hypothetical protein
LYLQSSRTCAPYVGIAALGAMPPEGSGRPIPGRRPARVVLQEIGMLAGGRERHARATGACRHIRATPTSNRRLGRLLTGYRPSPPPPAWVRPATSAGFSADFALAPVENPGRPALYRSPAALDPRLHSCIAKEQNDALDSFRNLAGVVGSRIGYLLHRRRTDSHPVGHCCGSSDYPLDPGTQDSQLARCLLLSAF